MNLLRLTSVLKRWAIIVAVVAGLLVFTTSFQTGTGLLRRSQVGSKGVLFTKRVLPKKLPSTAYHFCPLDVQKERATKSVTKLAAKPYVNNNCVTGFHPALKQGLAHSRKFLQEHDITPQKALSFMAAAIFMMMTLFTPLSAFAAPTGGRMGGSFGGSSRSSSAPSSRTYSSPGGYGQGYRTGYYSRPSVSISPFGGFGYGYSPFYSPFPVVTPGVGVGVISRGPSIFDVFFFGVFAWILLQVASSFTRPSSSSTFFDSFTSNSVLGSGVSVAQISVALNVPNRDDRNNILSYLDRLSETARTDSRVGVANLVSQVALELLRQRRSIFAASTSFKHYRSGDEAQRNFNTVAFKERSKFERETVNKYGGDNYAGSNQGSSSISALSKATVAVVTILIAIDGDSTVLPRIGSISDVETALTQIASDVKIDDSLRTAEILWTPEARDDVLGERDVYADYPELRSI